MAQTEKLIEALTKRGLLADESIRQESLRIAEQERQKALFHNTLALLKHYRDIVWVLESFPEQLAAELDGPLGNIDALIDRVDTEIGMEQHRMEYRLETMRTTRLLLDRVNDALSALKARPRDGRLMYDVLYHSFLCAEKLSHEEMLYRLNLSSRSFYRLRREAVTLLALRLWAAPDVRVEAWLELLAVLEG